MAGKPGGEATSTGDSGGEGAEAETGGGGGVGSKPSRAAASAGAPGAGASGGGADGGGATASGKGGDGKDRPSGIASDGGEGGAIGRPASSGSGAGKGAGAGGDGTGGCCEGAGEGCTAGGARGGTAGGSAAGGAGGDHMCGGSADPATPAPGCPSRGRDFPRAARASFFSFYFNNGCSTRGAQFHSCIPLLSSRFRARAKGQYKRLSQGVYIV